MAGVYPLPGVFTKSAHAHENTGIEFRSCAEERKSDEEKTQFVLKIKELALNSAKRASERVRTVLKTGMFVFVEC
jgi:hypothetical protein